MQQYFTANDIATDNKKRAILLSTCGAETYQLIRSLVALQKPTDKSLTDIITLVRDHHTPPPSAIVQRFHFHSHTQKEGKQLLISSPTYENSPSIAISVKRSITCCEQHSLMCEQYL